jgi:hydrogenase maturation protease
MTDDNSERILVLGLGNDILTDDAVGLHVARAVRERLCDEPDVVVRESMEMGMTLLDQVVGFRGLVLIDAVQTGRLPPGTVRTHELAEYRTFRVSTPHFLGLADTFALADSLSLPVPCYVQVVTIEVEDALTLGTELTPAVRDAVPRAVHQAVAHVRSLLLLRTLESGL